MPLAAGDRLGPYTVKGLLGIGGMGEVYRGSDLRLGRDVALKVISPALVGDPDLRRRFELEARAASALSHPGIVTVYDVGESDGMSWIAMEWVDGRTLRQALGDGALSTRDAWSVTRQVAHALAAAHAKGIVHRDLKPENIMLATEGQAKILDFGLARHTLVDSLEGSASATRTAGPGTVEGAILGTVGYMSPEQASGQPADYRSDQFSLGLVAYEMLAGRRAFARPTAVETLSAIIREDPVPIASVRGDVPDGLVRVIDRCLAKRPADRFESTRDLVTVLDVAGTGASGTTAAFRRPRIGGWGRAALASLAATAIAALLIAGWYGRTAPSPAAIDSLAVLPFANSNPDPDAEYLGDGLAESLIAQMSRVRSLKVMAHGTVARFKGTRNPQQAGQELRVGAVLTGRVSRQGSRLVINAELIDSQTGERLWGGQFDLQATDLLGVQDIIATQIADALHLRMSGAERQTLGGYSTTNAGAYDLFLKARYLMGGDTEEDDLEAKRLLELALARNPRFVEALIALAGIHVRSAGNGFAPPAEAFARSSAVLQQALEIDPGNAPARSSLATQRFLRDWDWAAAEREMRALIDDPRLYLTVQYHGMTMYLWAVGRADEALAVTERALRVDPGNAETRVMRADFLAHAGRLDDALRAYQEITTADPSDARAWFGRAEVLKRRGDITGAIDAARKAYELADEDYGVRALANATTERDFENAEKAVARVRLDDQLALARDRYVSPLELARLYAMAGDREKAFAGLDTALAERSPNLVLLKVDRAWDSVRDDPRFAAIVRKIGIP